jgi:hypothetical protein
VKSLTGCGGVAIKADLLEEYVTGAVLDALESPRVQEALRDSEDYDAPRRAELLDQIQDAQERRDEARRDYADRVIDRADWLDIRQRTEDDISKARREYDRLTGSATVLGDIPPTERVRDAWEPWSTDRKRAAIRAVLHRVIIKPLPPRSKRQRCGKQQEHNPPPRAGNGNPAPAHRIRLAYLVQSGFVSLGLARSPVCECSLKRHYKPGGNSTAECQDSWN